MSAIIEVILFLGVAFNLQFNLGKRRSNALSTVAFCAVLLLAWNLYPLSQANSNLFSLTGIPRSTSLDKMKSAYRQASIAKHPDHNPSPNALKEYEEFQEAFEILSDKDKRLRYELFGDWNQGAEIPDALHSASFYLAWLGILYYFSYVEEFRGTGKWQHFLLLAVASYELSIKTKPREAPPEDSSALTLHQQVELVKDLLPALMLFYYLFHFSVVRRTSAAQSYDAEPVLKEVIEKLRPAFDVFPQELTIQKLKALMAFRNHLKNVKKAEKNKVGGMSGQTGWAVKLVVTLGFVYAINNINFL